MVSASYTPADDSNDALVRQLADYERIAGYVWIVIGAIQTLAIVTAIAGIWNVIAGLSRFKMAKRILARDPTVPAAYEGMGQLVVIGVINLVFGAAIGLIGVGVDFFVRDKVLSNRALFDGATSSSSYATGGRDMFQEIEAFSALREKGLITEAEFAEQKRRILGILIQG